MFASWLRSCIFHGTGRRLSFNLGIIAMSSLLLLIAGVGSAKAASCSGNEFTFVNHNTFPIWLGELPQGGSAVLPIPNPDNNWKIAPRATVQICAPAGWSGNFWARTGCQFDTLYAGDPNHKTCSTDSDCSGGDVCWGGQCLLTGCSGQSPNGNQYCINQLGNENAQCQVQTLNNKTVSFCAIPQACETGDCGGLSQCSGTWDGVVQDIGGKAPVSLFEPTSNSATNVNYDASLVSGYNVPISVQPSVAASGANCYAPKCVSDLNATCPSALQVLINPIPIPSTGIPSTGIKCGNGYCASGLCQNKMCDVGCNQPGIQCTLASSSVKAELKCNTPVPAPSPSPSWTPDGATYEDMYQVKNVSGNASQNGVGDSMASGLQGTALCWGNSECEPGQTCQFGLLPTGYPATVGVCSGQAAATNCSSAGDAKTDNDCGNYYPNYADSLGYRCTLLKHVNNQVACLPPTTAGLGRGPYSGPQGLLFSGAGGLSNPEWMAAAMQAGKGGKPFFKIFSEACPHEYAWQYDDYTGGLDCNSGTGGANVNFTITFGLANGSGLERGPRYGRANGR